MEDQGKTEQQLLAELAELRRRVVALEAAAAERKQAEEDRRLSEAKWRSVDEIAPLFEAVVDLPARARERRTLASCELTRFRNPCEGLRGELRIREHAG